jgi:hypothetical protein
MLEEISGPSYQRWRVYYEVLAEEAEREREEIEAAQQRRR